MRFRSALELERDAVVNPSEAPLSDAGRADLAARVERLNAELLAPAIALEHALNDALEHKLERGEFEIVELDEGGLVDRAQGMSVLVGRPDGSAVRFMLERNAHPQVESLMAECRELRRRGDRELSGVFAARKSSSL